MDKTQTTPPDWVPPRIAVEIVTNRHGHDIYCCHVCGWFGDKDGYPKHTCWEAQYG